MLHYPFQPLHFRLPVVQGGTFTFVTPSLAILSLEQWSCDATLAGTNTTLPSTSDTTTPMTTFADVTMATGGFNGTGLAGAEPLWKPRIREVRMEALYIIYYQ